MSFEDNWNEWPSSDEESDRPNFQPGINDWERVGKSREGMTGEMPKSRIEISTMDPLERFSIYVDAIARSINNMNGINISEYDIEYMLNTAKKLQVVEHKNPTAYVLGFLAINEEQKLRKANFDIVINKVLPYVEDSSVLSPDIIRYARLWENHLI